MEVAVLQAEIELRADRIIGLAKYLPCELAVAVEDHPLDEAIALLVQGWRERGQGRACVCVLAWVNARAGCEPDALAGTVSRAFGDATAVGVAFAAAGSRAAG